MWPDGYISTKPHFLRKNWHMCIIQSKYLRCEFKFDLKIGKGHPSNHKTAMRDGMDHIFYMITITRIGIDARVRFCGLIILLGTWTINLHHFFLFYIVARFGTMLIVDTCLADPSDRLFSIRMAHGLRRPVFSASLQATTRCDQDYNLKGKSKHKT